MATENDGGGRRSTEKWERLMRADWDERARRNPMQYIAASDRAWNVERFYEAGREAGAALVRPVLAEYGLPPQGSRILEIGCGMGRMFPGFQGLGFGEIWGVDISPVMIEHGRAQCPVRDAHFVLGTGADLRGLPDDYFDFVVETHVFQHIPDRDIVAKYLGETERVLRAGGIYQLQFSRMSIWTTGRILAAVPEPFRPPLEHIYHRTIARLRDPRPFGGSLVGSPVTLGGARITRRWIEREVGKLEFVERKVRERREPGGPLEYWATGRKPRK